MDGLSESEELELLQLQKQKALSQGAVRTERSFSDVANLVPKMAGLAVEDVVNKTAPMLPPILGGMALGPAGAAIGTGAMATAQRMQNIANGSAPAPAMSDPNATLFPSSPKTMFKEGLPVAIQSGLSGIVQEPKMLNAIPGASEVKQMATNLANKTGRGITKAMQAFSGGQAGDFKEAAKKGISTYAAPSLPEAGAVYKNALDKLPGENVAPTMVEHIQSVVTPESSAGSKYLLDVGKRLDNGELLDARQALKAKQSLDDVIDTVPIWQIKRRGKLFDLKKTFDDILSSQSGEMKEASDTYRSAVLKDNLTKPFPVNKHGEYSRLAGMLSTVGGSVGGSIGGQKEGVKGGVAGALMPLAAAVALSPLALGGASAVGGSAARGLMKLGEDPAIRQALLAAFERINQRKK